MSLGLVTALRRLDRLAPAGYLGPIRRQGENRMARRRRDPETRTAAREISYASSAASRGGRAMIRVMENATGRLGLIKRAEGYGDEVRQGRDFWQVMVERYGLSLDVVGGSLDNIPREGPLIVIANHPYGILDGLMLGHILSQAARRFPHPGPPRVPQGRGYQPHHPAHQLRRHQGGARAQHPDPQGCAAVPVGRGRHRHLSRAGPCRRRPSPSASPWTPAGAISPRG
jgi:hypothetical protein